MAPVLQICEIRTIAADELWLSPCYQRDTRGASTSPGSRTTAAVPPVLAAIEERLTPLRRPAALGQGVRHRRREVIARAVPAPGRLPARWCARYDPAGKFRNDLLDRYLPPDR